MTRTFLWLTLAIAAPSLIGGLLCLLKAVWLVLIGDGDWDETFFPGLMITIMASAISAVCAAVLDLK